MIPFLIMLQATYCQPYLNGVQCAPQGDSGVSALQQQLLSPDNANGFQRGMQEAQQRALQRQLQQQQIESNRLALEQQRQANADAPAATIANNRDWQAARDKVGSLIEEGKCDAARRLSEYYGFPGIMNSARAACP